jgi:hypothetical protein
MVEAVEIEIGEELAGEIADRQAAPARDFTHDARHGCSGEKLAESIRQARDKRVKYIIWNRRICWSVAKGGSAAWAWRRYTGRNGHTQHVHVSVKPQKSLYDDASPWSLGLM